jgi:hypothetical protein
MVLIRLEMMGRATSTSPHVPVSKCQPAQHSTSRPSLHWTYSIHPHIHDSHGPERTLCCHAVFNGRTTTCLAPQQHDIKLELKPASAQSSTATSMSTPTISPETSFDPICGFDQYRDDRSIQNICQSQNARFHAEKTRRRGRWQQCPLA